MIKILLVVFGWFFLGLGIVGIFLPVLPTTPFVLLSAACFLKSSSRLHSWITNHRLFGHIINDYANNRSVAPRTRIVAIIFLWLSIGFSAVFITDNTIVRIILFLIAIAVTIHLALLKANRR